MVHLAPFAIELPSAHALLMTAGPVSLAECFEKCIEMGEACVGVVYMWNDSEECRTVAATSPAVLAALAALPPEAMPRAVAAASARRR